MSLISSLKVNHLNVNDLREIGDLTVTGSVQVAGPLQVAGAATVGALSLGAPVSVTAASATVSATTSLVICDFATTVTLTLPSPASLVGRVILVKNINGTGTVVSASSNVVPLIGGAAGTAILAAADGAWPAPWAALVSNGTNYVIMAA